MFYLFHHIPKTAGMSCLRAFGQMFNVVNDYHSEAKTYQGIGVDLAGLSEHDILCGHYNLPGSRLYDRYPDLDNYEHRKITFLRDPLEAAKSGVRFGAKRGWMDDADRMLLRRTDYFSRTLGCTEENYQSVLESYWFVGVTEQLEQGISEIAHRLGKSVPIVPKVNSTKQIDIDISDAAIRLFRERSTLDERLYRAARALQESFRRPNPDP